MLPWREPDQDMPVLSGEPVEEESKKAAGKAMRLLLQQDRTEKRLRECLYRAGFSEKAGGYALQYVRHFGYIDDLRYAKNYISYHKENRSRKELQYKLMERGVPAEQIQEAFREYEAEMEYGALRRQLHKRLKGKKLSGMDAPEREKITAYLVRKGYTLPAVRAIMREQMAEEEQEK